MKGGMCWRSPSAHGGLAVSTFSRGGGGGGSPPGGFLVFVCGVDTLMLPGRCFGACFAHLCRMGKPKFFC